MTAHDKDIQQEVVRMRTLKLIPVFQMALVLLAAVISTTPIPGVNPTLAHWLSLTLVAAIACLCILSVFLTVMLKGYLVLVQGLDPFYIAWGFSLFVVLVLALSPFPKAAILVGLTTAFQFAFVTFLSLARHSMN